MILNAIPITGQFRDMDQVDALALEAFPPEEYLAPSRMIDMAREDDFDFWALYDNDRFVGFMTVKRYQQLTYLFFLAIEPELRSHGYGGRAIETLKALYPGSQQVVDFERPDKAAVNSGQRERRRRFYLDNGYRPTGRFLSYLGVDYEIFCMEAAFDFGAFQKMMSSMRIDGFDPRYF